VVMLSSIMQGVNTRLLLVPSSRHRLFAPTAVSTISRLTLHHQVITSTVLSSSPYGQRAPRPSRVHQQHQRRFGLSKKLQAEIAISPEERLRRIEKGAQILHKMLDEKLHPLGSLQLKDYGDFEEGLRIFNFQKPTDAANVNLYIDVLERLCAEMAAVGNDIQLYWFAKAGYCTPMFESWKEAAINGEDVVSHSGLLTKLQNMYQLYPRMRVDRIVLVLMMDVVLKLEDPRQAPTIVENLLNLAIEDTVIFRQNQKHTPMLMLYNKLMQAWAASGLPEAEERIQGLFDKMRNKNKRGGKRPKVPTYNMLLEFYSGRADKIEEVLDMIDAENLKPEFRTWSLAVTGYCAAGAPEKAEDVMDDIVFNPKHARKIERDAFLEHIRHILRAYQAQADSITQRANAFHERMQQQGFDIHDNIDADNEDKNDGNEKLLHK